MFPKLVIALLLVVTPQLFILYGINILSSVQPLGFVPNRYNHSLVPVRVGNVSHTLLSCVTNVGLFAI